MGVYFIAADFFPPKSKRKRLRFCHDAVLSLLELVIVVKHVKVAFKLSLPMEKMSEDWFTPKYCRWVSKDKLLMKRCYMKTKGSPRQLTPLTLKQKR